MGHAAKALKQTHNNMDIDKVEDLMDEVREQQQIAEEISQVISNPIGFGQEVDEDELMKVRVYCLQCIKTCFNTYCFSINQ
jgi:charged multivesicular body protein 4